MAVRRDQSTLKATASSRPETPMCGSNHQPSASCTSLCLSNPKSPHTPVKRCAAKAREPRTTPAQPYRQRCLPAHLQGNHINGQVEISPTMDQTGVLSHKFENAVTHAIAPWMDDLVSEVCSVPKSRRHKPLSWCLVPAVGSVRPSHLQAIAASQCWLITMGCR